MTTCVFMMLLELSIMLAGPLVLLLPALKHLSLLLFQPLCP